MEGGVVTGMGRLAVLGGSFDPVACHHLDIVRWLVESASFDTVMVVPSAAHALKGDLSPYVHRLNMARLAVRDLRFAAPSLPRKTTVVASDIEMRMLAEQASPIHTIDLLRRLRHGPMGSRAAQIRFAIGPDIRDELHLWHDVEAIEREFGFVDVPVLSLRSTHIRSMIRAGTEAWKRHVPRSVGHYIELQRLYLAPCPPRSTATPTPSPL